MELGTQPGTTSTMAPHAANPDDINVDIQPGEFRVIKRNGVVVPFDRTKITVAITKAFLASEGSQAAGSARVREMGERFTDMVEATYRRRMPSGGTLHIEDIQDQVELVLMRAGEHKTAKGFVLYRAERAEQRAASAHVEELHPSINVKLNDGSLAPLDVGRLRFVVDEATADLDEVDGDRILEATLRNLYNGVPIKEVSTALVMASRVLVEEEPNYSQVTARLLMDIIRAEALSFMGIAENATHTEMRGHYAEALRVYLHKAADLELVSRELTTFDLDKLGAAIEADRDLQFGYLGLQTLYDRYFIHSNETRFELPQVFFMRVAMGLSLEEENREDSAIEFYRLLSSFDYMSSTPTLFNAGTLRSQLSSCYLTTVPDDLSEIYGAIRDNALLSKFAGGLGNDWTPVRSLGSRIKGTNGKSQGVVPFLKVANDTAVAVNQGGKRKGAVCAYLETWHLDIEEFLELRKNTGDDRRRTHDMNTANWVPDLFMKRVFQDGDWTLFSPADCPDLHDLVGDAFEARYTEYEAQAAAGDLPLHRTIKAADLWRKMLSMLFETGHPWITFKDACNLRSPQQHVGVIHSSNLCTEITLNTSIDEIAVCNLGSVNLKAHVSRDGGLDHEKLKRTVTTAIRMLDNVIDINYYSVPQAKNSNMKHRPIGLGLMGFQDALYEMGYAYGSDDAVRFADQTMEAISYYAIEASSDLAADRGAYQTYKGSLWDQGVF
ncbi:MAG: ribonucleoside-diphosphate reductase subunit alpha, partial [Litorivicinus sp.]